MILHRLTRSVRDQNWFAVVLECTIVIAGVVLGLQIARAAEDAAKSRYERDLVGRLYEQVISLQEQRAASRQRVLETRNQLVEARPMLFGLSDSNAMSSDQCFALIASHHITNPAGGLPALDELIATGRMETISNDRLRESAARYLQARDAAAAQIDYDLASLISLPERFPDYFRLELNPDPDERDDGWDSRASCDLAAMQADASFQLMASSNIELYRRLLGIHYQGVGEQLDALQAAVSEELGRQPAAH